MEIGQRELGVDAGFDEGVYVERIIVTHLQVHCVSTQLSCTLVIFDALGHWARHWPRLQIFTGPTLT